MTPLTLPGKPTRPGLWNCPWFAPVEFNAHLFAFGLREHLCGRQPPAQEGTAKGLVAPLGWRRWGLRRERSPSPPWTERLWFLLRVFLQPARCWCRVPPPSAPQRGSNRRESRDLRWFLS